MFYLLNKNVTLENDKPGDHNNFQSEHLPLLLGKKKKKSMWGERATLKLGLLHGRDFNRHMEMGSFHLPEVFDVFTTSPQNEKHQGIFQVPKACVWIQLLKDITINTVNHSDLLRTLSE